MCDENQIVPAHVILPTAFIGHHKHQGRQTSNFGYLLRPIMTGGIVNDHGSKNKLAKKRTPSQSYTRGSSSLAVLPLKILASVICPAALEIQSIRIVYVPRAAHEAFLMAPLASRTQSPLGLSVRADCYFWGETPPKTRVLARGEGSCQIETKT